MTQALKEQVLTQLKQEPLRTGVSYYRLHEWHTVLKVEDGWVTYQVRGTQRRAMSDLEGFFYYIGVP